MKSIPLTQGHVTIVDDEDYASLSQYKWRLGGSKQWRYAVRHIQANGKRTYLSMHRVILHAPRGAKVDHWSGDGLDNRRKNLRLCTNQENLCNSKVRTNNKSGFKGVLWVQSLGKWRAKVMQLGKQIHLGYFDNPLDAAKAYNAAALKYHGAFARLNPIPS